MKRTALLKLITGILVSCAVVLCGTRVFADVIMEPYGEGSDFYAKHYGECEIEYNVRGYSALTDFDIYPSPVDDKVVRHVQKGDVLRSNTFYTDSEGVRWAYDYNWDATGKTGWYKTENVELVYDYISFEEEHKNELTDYKGQLNDYVPEKQVVLWTYPGSGEIRSIRTQKNWFPEGYVFTIEDTAEYTYVDESETEWVFLGYGFNSWVDLSDIEGEAYTEEAAETTVSEDSRIYVTTEAIEEASEIVLAISNIPEPPTPDENEKPNFMLPIVLALCAAAAAGGFLVGTKRKKP
ncbi:MAG: hypothetical protein K2N72_05100 [Oscillospiraceae bacterium]|nr:hypothetical protein [Oscillospiraceae bacterium]